jgi:hypothetical protein
MLYLISKPFHLSAGNYDCKQISTDDAALLIRLADSAGEMRSLVHFASTAAAIRALTAVDVSLVERAEIPKPEQGDRFLDIRLKASVQKGQRIGLTDLEFWQIDYESKKASADWPVVLG